MSIRTATRFMPAYVLGPVLALAVLASCKSQPERPENPHYPGGENYYGTGHPDVFANEHYVDQVGYGNQRGHLNDRGRMRAPEPPPPPPPHIPPPPPPPPPADLTRCVMAFPTGDRATSVVLLETMTPAEVRVGQAYDYEMRVTNLTNLIIEDVVVIDVMQGNYTMATSVPPAARGAGNEAVWNLGRLGPGETKAIRVTGSAVAAGAVTRCARVTYNSQCCVTTRVVAPALALKKTAPPEVLACDEIVLGFTVTNSGSGVARAVRIEDPLPQGWTTRDGQRNVVIDVGHLDTGQSRDFKVPVKCSGPGRFDNTATAKAEGGLEARSNTTTTVVKNCALVVTKTAPEKRFIGREIEYEITVTNKGDGEARDTILEDALPAGCRFVRASDGGADAGGKITWRLGTLAPGASRKVSCAAMAGQGGMLRNVATARAYCCPPASAEANTQVEGIAAVLLEVVDDPDPIELGKEVLYTITVTNQGFAPDTNIVVTFTLEEQAGFVAAAGATPLAAAGAAPPAGGSFTFAPLASLPAKQRATWTVRVKALAPGDTRFRLSCQTQETGRPIEETEATRFY